jgi:hypothetical protein
MRPHFRYWLPHVPLAVAAAFIYALALLAVFIPSALAASPFGG